ncbi:Hypothetical_protein [Hexamita inflata]|uniref:Hypothetical_protein n=1 Tax=Hexamita inflata TaxID=28002 RepID=A0ABP1GZ28_9EUKA
MMVYFCQDTVHHVVMAHCSDSGVSVASDFVLGGHFLSTQQTLAVRVELFVQNLKSVFYQVEEFIIGQISEIVDGIAYGLYSMVILKGVEVFFPQSFDIQELLLLILIKNTIQLFYGCEKINSIFIFECNKLQNISIQS